MNAQNGTGEEIVSKKQSVTREMLALVVKREVARFPPFSPLNMKGNVVVFRTEGMTRTTEQTANRPLPFLIHPKQQSRLVPWLHSAILNRNRFVSVTRQGPPRSVVLNRPPSEIPPCLGGRMILPAPVK